MKKAEENKNLPYSKLAIASLVMGVIGTVFGSFYFIISLLSIPAFITGILALINIHKNKGIIRGRVFAWIGIIISSIQIVKLIISVVIISMITTCVNTAFSNHPVPYENAVKHMDKTNLAYYNSTISKINEGTSDKDVEKILGKPKNVDSYSKFILYGYDCPKSSIKDCSIHVIFKDHTTQAVLWFNDTKFWFARNFDESDNAYFNGEPNAPMEGWLDYILLQHPTKENCYP